MPQLPLPPQLSTDPNVNASAMAWAAQLVDALQKIITGSTASGVNADKLDGIDSLGFLKLATVANRKLNFAAASISFSAASFATVTVTHGLGAVPVAIVATPNTSTGNPTFVVNVNNSPTSSQFDLLAQTRDNSAVTLTLTVYWLAIA